MSPPSESQHRTCIFPKARISIGASRSHYENFLTAQVAKNLPQEGCILTEAAWTCCSRHEKGHPRGIESGLLYYLEEISYSDPFRQALLPRCVSPSKFVSSLVSFRRRTSIYSESPEGCCESSCSLVRHSRDIEGAPFEISPAFFHHLRTPLLSRYASHRVIVPASLLCPSN